MVAGLLFHGIIRRFPKRSDQRFPKRNLPMNLRLLCKLLALVAMLIGVSMVFSLPWAIPLFGGDWAHEREGFFGLIVAMGFCFITGSGLRFLGRHAKGRIFRKEAMAVVGLSWILATLLGALPYLLSGTHLAEGTPMTVVDAMFEAQSGFSTTGATVLTDIENRELVPRCILFWRSSTHFLGGLGIIVLFVAILGQGSAGKALMRTEMPGPESSTPQARMQQTAWILFMIYAGLNAILAILLLLQNLSLFDALCHAFGTMATGGFSTYNLSVGHFATQPELYNAPLIEMTITVFMVLAGTNFMLMYWVVIGKVTRLINDVEWRTYISIILIATFSIVGFGLLAKDFGADSGMADMSHLVATEDGSDGVPIGTASRYGLFQVVSIMTTTGFCTDDFNAWSSFGKGLLLLLMFVGGCAGSTGGGMKVIRHIFFFKILRPKPHQAVAIRSPSASRKVQTRPRAGPDPAFEKRHVYGATGPLPEPPRRSRIRRHAGFAPGWHGLLAQEPT